MVRKDSQYRHEELRRRRRVALDETTIFVVAPEDLIISKLDWARDTRSPVQLADVRICWSRSPTSTRHYLARWIAHLGLETPSIVR